MRAAAGLALLPLLVAWAASAQAPASTGVYTAAQAERGGALYAQHCARCHGDALEGTDVAQPLTGLGFLDNWTGQPIAVLIQRIHISMPLETPGLLDAAASVDVTAFMLQTNGYPPGKAALPADASSPLDGPTK